jgi:hypothetical protein
MPSIEHEAAVQILHADPQLAAILLGSCGVLLPSGAVAVTADSNLSDRDPTDLRSDNILIFEGIGGKVAVIAEVQKDKRDAGRMRSWPAYVCNARAEHDCDAILLVLALSARAAQESARLIRTGHPGFDLVPLVRGPGTLPHPGHPIYGPQLTVLNILTGDLDLTNHAARMFALLAIAEAPAELREGYTRIIRAVAPESARAALEELMMTHLRDDFVDGFLDQGRAEGRAQGVAQGVAQGMAQGMAQGEAHILLRIMAARGLDIPEHIRARVAECADTARLEAWADRAATATSVDEIFGD